MISSLWRVPDIQPPLGDDEVHVWRVALPMPVPQAEALRRSLSADEIDRAERFRLPKLRHNFVVARGTLRSILAGYLGVEPSQVSLGYQPHGKPTLDGNVHPQPIHFNLSHSGDWALYAVALRREVGIDIESHRLARDFDGIVNRFFSPGERTAISSLAEEQRPAAFFRYWTVKEAYLKAHGTGLSSPLDQFEVTFPSDAQPVIRAS
jgi:4'-phosphopantetheinyl transferase